MNNIKRNRAVVAIVMALLALIAYGLNYFGVIPRTQVLPDGFDPVAAGYRIEEAMPHVDVLHIGPVEAGTFGVPAFHVGVLMHLVENPYAIELGDDYRILTPDEYTWTEELGDDGRRRWTEAKAQYFSDHALFRPGEMEEVEKAVRYLDRWHDEELLVRFFLAVFKEAVPYADEWTVVEISFLGLGPDTMMPGIDQSGEPGYVMGKPAQLQVIGTLYKKEILPDPKPGQQEDNPMRGYYMYEAVQRDEFPREKLVELMGKGTIGFQLAVVPFLGEIPYRHGFNHPWRADGIKD